MLERLGGKKAGGDGWWKGKKKGNKGEEVGRKGIVTVNRISNGCFL